ncbi:MAG: hypothetical protein J5994_03315 [Ruminococcus sp.]|nr:hypothetical protein [Ruminococcus sp.]
MEEKAYTKKSRLIAYIILAVIIAVQLVYTSYLFTQKKEGYHSDEIWSYGLSNSYYKPFFHLKDNVMNSIVSGEEDSYEDIDNIQQWIPPETFRDYLTVQPGERFSYGSVVHNQSLDNHPPGYYFLIHTVSSLFPNKFSFFYGFALNCIFLVVTQIYLYKLSKLVIGGKNVWLPLLVCALYGFGIGATSTFIFIRIYAMLAMLTTMHIYYQFRYYTYPDMSKVKLLIPVAVTAFAGFMTEYLFIAAAGICTACLCIIFLFRKEFKRMFALGLTMLGSLALFVLIYFSSIIQIGGYHVDKTLTVYEQFRRLLSLSLYPTVGVSVSVMRSSAGAYFFAVLVILLAILIPLVFLFRKEEWFKKFAGRARTVVLKIIADIKAAVNVKMLILAVISVAHIITVACVTNTFMNGTRVMRYVMSIMPVVVLTAFSLIYCIVRIIPKAERYAVPVMLAVNAAILVHMYAVYDNYFFFEQPEGSKDLAETAAGSRCVAVIKNDWYSTCFTPFMLDCRSCYFSRYDSAVNGDLSEVVKPENGETMYLIIPQTAPDDSEEDPEDEWLSMNTDGMDNKTENELEKIISSVGNSGNVTSIEEMYYINVQGADYCVYKIT